MTCYILQDKWARLDLHNGFYFSDRKTDCLLMNFFVLREEFFRQLVCLIDKEGYVLIRELVLIAIFGNVGREKKRHQKILFTLQLTSKFTWTKIMVSVDGLVISQIGGLFYITVSFICHFPSTGSGQVFLCEKGL